MPDEEQPTARISGPVTNAREYKCSVPEIEWSCCPGVICGHARRTGVNADGLAVYRMSGRRHPAMTGASFIVDPSGILLAYNGNPIKRRCAMYGGL